MSFPSNGKSEIAGLKNFLTGNNQYPFSGKRHLLNRLISFCSRLNIKNRKESCDVIFILASPELAFRYSHIVKALHDMGLTCKTLFFSNRDIMKVAFYGALSSTEKISEDFAMEKGLALYLKHTYSPKIIFQADDSNYISTFLKRFSGATLINIAHCVSCISAHFNFFDFHYYFIFGDSSENNLKKIDPSYGNTRLVKTGSLFLKKQTGEEIDNLHQRNGFSRYILFSSQWLSSGIVDDINWSREMVNLLGERNPGWKITIKCHPLEANMNWVKPLPNIFVEEGDTDFRHLLSDTDFHITHHSAFALEASVCNVPTICIQRKNFKEGCLSFKKYFPVTDSINELERMVNEHSSSLYDLQGFIKWHLSNVGSEMETFTTTVNQILQDKPVNSYSLAGTYAD